jgi:hypothetical protein
MLDAFYPLLFLFTGAFMAYAMGRAEHVYKRKYLAAGTALVFFMVALILQIYLAPLVWSSGAQSFTIGDCNGDGWPDLIAPGQNANDVTILGGDGTGRFRFMHRNLVATLPTGAACVDFDGDGRVEFRLRR